MTDLVPGYVILVTAVVQLVVGFLLGMLYTFVRLPIRLKLSYLRWRADLSNARRQRHYIPMYAAEQDDHPAVLHNAKLDKRAGYWYTTVDTEYPFE